MEFPLGIGPGVPESRSRHEIRDEASGEKLLRPGPTAWRSAFLQLVVVEAGGVDGKII